MAKDLTTSQVDRQNILNNDLAVSEIQKTSKIDCVFFEDKLYLTKEMVKNKSWPVAMTSQDFCV